MRATEDGTLHLAPTDLSTFSACKHASHLFWKFAQGTNEVDPIRDPDADVLAELGTRHEQKYVDHLRAMGLEVVKMGGSPDHQARLEATEAAMRAGHDAIVQAPLAYGRWRGVADVLMRVPGRSALGDFHYEIQDTKLSGNTKVGTILQLSLYSAWLGETQSRIPDGFQVVTPDGDGFRTEGYRVNDFGAYVRRVRTRFEGFLAGLEDGTVTTDPEPVEMCQICPWWRGCNQLWHDEDRLNLVPGLGRGHRNELEKREIDTVVELAGLEEPMPFRPEHGSRDAYLSSAHQAQMQVETRRRKQVAWELLPVELGKGLTRLPEPSDGDLFFDLEGHPFFGTGGLEYLWGWTDAHGDYTCMWALDQAAEKRALERFIDLVIARRSEFLGMHIDHYGSYEAGALKRLTTRHATREEELDVLLRAEVFVDLGSVTRQAVRIGVESYSLKDLERVHGYVRDADLRSVSPHKRALEHGLILGTIEEVLDESRETVRVYNRDDVISTIWLRRWLEARRQKLIERGEPVPRPDAGDGEASDAVEEHRREATAVIEALQTQLPEDPAAWSEEHEALSLLAAMIDFERREDKVGWWDYFAHVEYSTEELEDSRRGVVGLRAEGKISGTDRSPIIRFRFPPQDTDIRGGEEFVVSIGGEPATVAGVAEFDPVERTIDLKMRGDHAGLRPREGFVYNQIPTGNIPAARMAFARDVLERGMDAPGPYRVCRDMVLRIAGRSADASTGALRLAGESTLDATKRFALDLDGGVLPVQGPPGTGKTFTGARVIVELASRGRPVAVTAVSHKVIANLLEGVVKAAAEAGVNIRVGHKVSRGKSSAPGVEAIYDNGTAESLTQGERIDVLGGTAWLWTRKGMQGWADTLVIDEAGQMSLAMALSVATCARNVILLGDPQQLEQPIQASHPEGSDVAVLAHMIGEHDTLPVGHGLFLDTTYRLAPELCEFTSSVFYENRLEPEQANRRIELRGTDGFDGVGITYLKAAHEDRDGRSPEEAELVAKVVDRIVRTGATFVDRDGEERRIARDDVLVVAPFNRHVDAIARACAEGTRVGTVDRFQGQEAPVVIYAMGVSSPELAPRGLEFLFSGNRLNVASSRAQARVILIANEALFDAVCKTPDEMRLVNAHVRLLEMAEE